MTSRIVNLLIYAFAFIGIFACLLLLVSTCRQINSHNMYARNCNRISEGMNWQQVMQIMGTKEGGKEYSIHIGEPATPLKGFTLVFPGRAGSSTDISIDFEATTMTVVSVFCGDSPTK